MDTRFGAGWRLVHDPTVHPPPGSPLTVIALGTGDAVEEAGVVARWMGRHGCHAALVRPDHYVFGVAADARELAALLEDLGRQLDVDLARAGTRMNVHEDVPLTTTGGTA